jgi:hypothetical protein
MNPDAQRWVLVAFSRVASFFSLIKNRRATHLPFLLYLLFIFVLNEDLFFLSGFQIHVKYPIQPARMSSHIIYIPINLYVYCLASITGVSVCTSVCMGECRLTSKAVPVLLPLLRIREILVRNRIRTFD